MPPGAFWSRVREARLVRVLVVYLAASWLVLQVIALLQDRLRLPEWLTPVAVALLLVGLVVVLATAWVQAHPATRARAQELPAAWEVDLGGFVRSLAKRRLPHLTWARAILGVVVAFSLLFGASGIYLYLKGRGAALSVVKEASAAPGPGVAVLPFRVVGPGLELWREGMMDLLSTNLDGAAGLRKIDPRTVLSRWRSEIGEGAEAPDPQAALGVARNVGASYAVIGSAVALGAGVRLTAETYDLTTGTLQGTAIVEGPADSVFALVNDLSIQVLQAGLAGERAGLPQLDLRRVTTTSLPALKAYLAGEQSYRGSRFRDAIAELTRAVEADSTFALALHRLAQAYGWLAQSKEEDEYAQRAIRFVDRLPQRDALLLKASSLIPHGLRALEILEELTARFPDYAEGWYLLGDGYFHLGPQGLFPRERYVHAFRTALDLDPSFGPAYLHLIDDAFGRGDSAEARELIAGAREADPLSPRVIGQELAYALGWGDSGYRTRAKAALDTATAAVLEGAAPLLYAPDFWEGVLEVGQALARPRHPLSARRFGQIEIIRAHVWRGRLREARAAVSAFPGEDAFGPGASRLHLTLYLAGYRDTSAVRQAAASLASSSAPSDRLLLGAFSAEANRWAEVERDIQALERDAEEAELQGDTLGAADARAFDRGLQAYAALRRGDRRAAIVKLEEALPGLASGLAAQARFHEVLRYEAGKVWLELGNLRQAERYFHSVEPYLFIVSTPAQFYLGEVYEALGDVERAKFHYARFVRWWEDCDPDLRPWWERGRQALARLTREAASR
ncbi:MAG: hypothetical protein HY702_06000 [Gemmatimonadetes bacterium]|nr:hypothetical protein [Gemmatimonadota bacterium]